MDLVVKILLFFQGPGKKIQSPLKALTPKHPEPKPHFALGRKIPAILAPMSYALEIRTEEKPAPVADGFAICDLWMLPIVLLALIFDKFRRHVTRLKQMRRTRPMPKDWRSFYPELRRCEWAIHMLSFEGARQILLGEDLDISALSYDPEPPDSFQPPMPRSALAMHQRMQDIACFHADPERYIRRHAARIAERNSDCDDDRERDSDRIPDSDSFVAVPLAVAVPLPVAVAIRGPPQGG